MKMFLRILFLSLSNTNIDFGKAKQLIQRKYLAVKALPTTYQMELIDKKKFIKMVLDKNLKTFIEHIAALEIFEMAIHPSQANQIP